MFGATLSEYPYIGHYGCLMIVFSVWQLFKPFLISLYIAPVNVYDGNVTDLNNQYSKIFSGPKVSAKMSKFMEEEQSDTFRTGDDNYKPYFLRYKDHIWGMHGIKSDVTHIK